MLLVQAPMRKPSIGAKDRILNITPIVGSTFTVLLPRGAMHSAVLPWQVVCLSVRLSVWVLLFIDAFDELTDKITPSVNNFVSVIHFSSYAVNFIIIF